MQSSEAALVVKCMFEKFTNSIYYRMSTYNKNLRVTLPQKVNKVLASYFHLVALVLRNVIVGKNPIK